MIRRPSEDREDEPALLVISPYSGFFVLWAGFVLFVNKKKQVTVHEQCLYASPYDYMYVGEDGIWTGEWTLFVGHIRVNALFNDFTLPEDAVPLFEGFYNAAYRKGDRIFVFSHGEPHVVVTLPPGTEPVVPPVPVLEFVDDPIFDWPPKDYKKRTA